MANVILHRYDINSMRKTAIEIIGEEEGKCLKEPWGLDDEGQLRGVWRDSGRKCAVLSRATVVHVMILLRSELLVHWR